MKPSPIEVEMPAPLEKSWEPMGVETKLAAIREAGILGVICGLLLLIAAGLFALHYVHITADFPDHSPWMDWSKYTDEGWYGDAAIRQLQRGHWYLRGDFNPAVALPVWPLIEYAFFSISGVSVVAARALSVSIFGLTLITAYFLIRRCAELVRPSLASSLAPATSVALLAASPFCFVFTRLAILEPVLVLFGLLALLSASLVKPPDRTKRGILPLLCLGALMPLMVLTKTTAIFLVPSIAWMLWATCGYRIREFFVAATPVGGVALTIWSAYFFFFVRPHFLADYRYLFSANAYTGMTPATFFSIVKDTFLDGMWMGKILYPLAVFAILLALAWFRRMLRNPLVPSLILWIAGYSAFLAYHDNLQPRYYLVIAVPMTMLLPVVVEEFLYLLAPGAKPHRVPAPRFSVPLVFAMVLAVAGFLAILLTDMRQTFRYAFNPVYAFSLASQGVRSVVLADHGHSPLLLSISGSDISLMTGLPSICDDFGTMSLEDRVAAYSPGWYAAWNEMEDDKMDALSQVFHVQRVAEFPAFDDPERNLLILYRLDPPMTEAPHKKHAKSVPKPLRTRIGQQPSVEQLEH